MCSSRMPSFSEAFTFSGTTAAGSSTARRISSEQVSEETTFLVSGSCLVSRLPAMVTRHGSEWILIWPAVKPGTSARTVTASGDSEAWTWRGWRNSTSASYQLARSLSSRLLPLKMSKAREAI